MSYPNSHCLRASRFSRRVSLIFIFQMHRVRESNPSHLLEGQRISPEIQRDIGSSSFRCALRSSRVRAMCAEISLNMALPRGFEPTLCELKARCPQTNRRWKHCNMMFLVGAVGLEPTSAGLRVRYNQPLYDTPMSFFRAPRKPLNGFSQRHDTSCSGE